MIAPPEYVAVSDPGLEPGEIRLVTYKSAAIARRQDMLLVVPESAPVDAPLAILLHGVEGSHWAWAFNGGAHETLRRLVDKRAIPPMALALPSDGLWGDGSGYLPHRGGEDYEQLILEVPSVAGLVDHRITERSPVFVAGLSMGGYGALRLGAKHHDRFAAVAAHSAITTLATLQGYVREDLSQAVAPGLECDVLYWIERASSLPPIRFDCGIDDALLDENRTLHRELERLGVDHEYEEFEGGHEWSYWRAHLADSLEFFGSQVDCT